MKKILLLVSILAQSACSSSALILANTLARFDNYKLTENISYAEHEKNKLDVYQPAEKPRGTIVFFYGGCWGACTRLTREKYRFVAQALTAKGYLVVIPDYRRYPDVLFPQIMEDSAAVVRWVQKNITQYEGDPEQLFLMGHSSGGHLAAMLTVNESYLGSDLHKNIQGFIGLAAPYDFIFDEPYLEKLFATVDYAESQPSTFIDGSEPPLLLLYGDKDTSVYPRNIINMEKAVRKKKGKAEVHIYKDVDHVDILSAFSIPLRNHYKVMQDVTDFLEKSTH